MASNLFCCHSCQAPFSAVLATYTDRFEHECPEKTNRLAAQKEKNRNSPVDENVSGSEIRQYNPVLLLTIPRHPGIERRLFNNLLGPVHNP